MNIECLKQIITEWASELPYKINVYGYGSQFKGSAKKESDVDLAVEFLEPMSENQLTFLWMDNHEKWERYLSKKIGKKVHLQPYEQDGTPRLKSYLAESSLLLYSSY